MHIPKHIPIPILKLDLAALNSIRDFKLRIHPQRIPSRLHYLPTAILSPYSYPLFAGFWWSLRLIDKTKRQWSEMDNETCWILACGKILVHASLATILSSLSLVDLQNVHYTKYGADQKNLDQAARICLSIP